MWGSAGHLRYLMSSPSSICLPAACLSLRAARLLHSTMDSKQDLSRCQWKMAKTSAEGVTESKILNLTVNKSLSEQVCEGF